MVEVQKYLAGFDERDAALNKRLPIMDVVGEQGRAKWKQHEEGIWIPTRPDTQTTDNRENKTVNFGKTCLGRAGIGTMSLFGHAHP